jgi:tRNA ligase
MNGTKYHDVPSPLPIFASGLFTREISDDSQKAGEASKTYEIVARGYDKIFNIGEIPWTTVGILITPFSFVTDCIFQWLSLETNSTAPYTLLFKATGWIIFITALTPTKLLITSKHAVGPVAGREMSYSEAGEEWLRKYLANKGKTEADLAARLWESNLTAVAEVIFYNFPLSNMFNIPAFFNSYVTIL